MGEKNETFRRDEGRDDVSLSSALERVLAASQAALLARVELLRVEAEEDFSHAIWSLALIATGALGFLCGWICFVVLIVRGLDHVLSLEASLGLVGTSQGIFGTALIVSGVRMLRRIRLMKPDGAPADEERRDA